MLLLYEPLSQVAFIDGVGKGLLALAASFKTTELQLPVEASERREQKSSFLCQQYMCVIWDAVNKVQ